MLGIFRVGFLLFELSLSEVVEDVEVCFKFYVYCILIFGYFEVW